jgi:hypothetical protein
MSIEKTGVPMNPARANLVALQLLREARGIGGADVLSASDRERAQYDRDFMALVETLTAFLQGHAVQYDDGAEEA